mmetsp:Transcript_140324/g.349827  ORF Transcript_140324/g.349827 Transcript_140324/m.349827 type:complete len:84 (-) Transcript_140324:177-428(-)
MCWDRGLAFATQPHQDIHWNLGHQDINDHSLKLHRGQGGHRAIPIMRQRAKERTLPDRLQLQSCAEPLALSVHRLTWVQVAAQ